MKYMIVTDTVAEQAKPHFQTIISAFLHAACEKTKAQARYSTHIVRSQFPYHSYLCRAATKTRNMLRT